MADNRVSRMFEIANKFDCFMEQASRLYEKAEKEDKTEELMRKVRLGNQRG